VLESGGRRNDIIVNVKKMPKLNELKGDIIAIGESNKGSS